MPKVKVTVLEGNSGTNQYVDINKLGNLLESYADAKSIELVIKKNPMADIDKEFRHMGQQQIARSVRGY